MTDALLFFPLLLLALYGLFDLYCCWRFVRKPEIDKTAGFAIWLMLKWGFASQTKAIAQKLPFVSQDLNEIIGVRPDDGKVT